MGGLHNANVCLLSNLRLSLKSFLNDRLIYACRRISSRLLNINLAGTRISEVLICGNLRMLRALEQALPLQFLQLADLLLLRRYDIVYL